ncbi:unnamed protein product [Phytophthora fragariaefolia]|uniref:Unnamed protein product n=1 Tax=Phytophthora fragariaefolia TaxID=1490495 RepID=A0A9W6XFX0_9STRA|nr:unnamed protein product [Phytophthora fragariaefolia]
MSLWGREDPNDPDENSTLTIVVLYCRMEQFTEAEVAGNDFLCPLPTDLLPSNLTCICGSGYTINSSRITASDGRVDSSVDFKQKLIPANEAADVCVRCPDGSFSNSTTNEKCTLCPAGSVPALLTSGRADHCKFCLPGTFANVSGSRSCTPCPPGTFSTGVGATWCSLCNPGEFAAGHGSSRCAVCPVGTFSNSKGATVCSSCPAGSYVDAEGEAECVMCSKGTYQDVIGSVECRTCPVGYIAPSVGHERCLPCAPGSFYDSEAKMCLLCPPGTFAGAPAQTECSKCSNGTVAESVGSETCLAVAHPGWGYESFEDTAVAAKCGAGMFNDGAWRTCQRCLPGTFAADVGSQRCISCEKGSFAATESSAKCEEAPVGSFVEREGTARAELCPPNHIADTKGSVKCTACQLPTFSFLTGGSKCIIAKPGEVYQHVEWPRALLSLAGVEMHDIIRKGVDSVPIIEVLILAWIDILTSYTASNYELHVLQVVQANTSILTWIIVAIETLESTKGPAGKNFPGKVGDAVHQAAEAAESAFEGLLSELNASFSTKGGESDKHLADLVSSISFRDTLVRQFDHLNLFDRSLTFDMVNLTAVDPPFSSTRAVACIPGTYFVQTDTDRECRPCAAGSFSTSSGSLKCEPCARGTFSAIEGLTMCEPCPAGSDAARGASSCVTCTWFTYDCEGFWENLIVAVCIGAALLRMICRKLRTWGAGDNVQREQDASVAMMAAVRTHGRTLDQAQYDPMLAETSPQKLIPAARPVSHSANWPEREPEDAPCRSPMLGTQAPASNWGTSFGTRTDMDSVPLFEREHRNDSQLVQRLQNELADAKRFVEAQARRQNDLEYVNEDLERRLEHEALDRITLDAQKAEDEKRWQQEKAALQEQLKSWEARFEEETRRRAMAEERLRRAEKELYRMHQKKYDIEKQVRREESEKRKHEAVIVRSLQSDSQRAQQSAANGFLDPTVNPKDAKPATVRTRQALSSAMDFLGV